MVEPEYLIPCCEYYLAHPEECERIARQAWSSCRKNCVKAKPARVFQQLEADTALGIEAFESKNNIRPAVWRTMPRSSLAPGIDAPTLPTYRAIAGSRGGG